MRLALQRKLLAGYLVVAGVALGVGGWLALNALEAKDSEQVRSGLAAEARLAAELLAAPLARLVPDVQEIDTVADRLGEMIRARVTVMTADGRVLGDSYESGEALRGMDNHLTRPEVRDALATGLGVSVRPSDTVGIPMLNLAVPVRAHDPSHVVGLVRVSLPLTEIEARHRALRNALAAAFGVAFFLSLALSYLAARNVTRPLAEMVSAAERMARGQFHPRIRAHSNDEMTDLARVLNVMAASIEETIDSLIEDRAKMAATLTAMQEGVMVLASDGTIQLVNAAMEKMIGRKEGDIVERTYLEAIRQARLNDFITEALARGGSSETEVALGTSPARIFQVRASALSPGTDHFLGLVLVFHDITELRHLEQVRKDFVANVSHELRTPLTAIKGYVEALRDDPKIDSPQRQRFLETIETHTNRLNLIITDLLLLSKIESGQIPLKQEQVELALLLERAFGLLNHQIHRKRHKIVSNVPRDLPPVLGDEERLGQVFSNLLDNAIKYTPDEGTITITAGEEGGMIQVCVEDTGIGISQKDLPRIFERFYRVDKARSRELGGTGLGLAIVKHVVEAHGGTVSAESSGKGSRFTVQLPAASN